MIMTLAPARPTRLPRPAPIGPSVPSVLRRLAIRPTSRYGIGMARTRKVTFTLDEETAQRIDRAALRLGKPKSAVVRDAVAEFDARAGRLSEAERVRMLAVLDDFMSRVPAGDENGADAELAELRRARQHGGRRTRVE